LKPIPFPTATRTLGEAQGHLPLPIEDLALNGEEMMFSVWELDDEERARLLAGGRVGLLVYGNQHPPVMLVTLEAGDG
jgi:hypothetical protein